MAKSAGISSGQSWELLWLAMAEEFRGSAEHPRVQAPLQATILSTAHLLGEMPCSTELPSLSSPAMAALSLGAQQWPVQGALGLCVPGGGVHSSGDNTARF